MLGGKMGPLRRSCFFYILCIALVSVVFWLYAVRDHGPAYHVQHIVRAAPESTINSAKELSVCIVWCIQFPKVSTLGLSASDLSYDFQQTAEAALDSGINSTQKLPADEPGVVSNSPGSDHKTQKSVLMLIADDMRPEMGSYIDPAHRPAFYEKIHTPNLDKLAQKSLVLKRAYVQQALCSPSRASLLTGRRPDTTRVYDIGTYWRTAGGNFTTLPQYFKQQGYVTACVGKVFHELTGNGFEYPLSWSFKPEKFDNSQWKKERFLIWSYPEEEKLAKHPLEDMQIAKKAIEKLKLFASKPHAEQKPFFLAVGFRRPHLPLHCPKKYFDMYPKEDIELPKNPYAPQYMPELAWSNYGGVRQYGLVREYNLYGDINTTLPDNLTKDIRRAYYACVSYVDDLLGNVLDTLKTLGLEKNTIVTFFGDHGYQLGEHGEWEKQTTFELANHAPLLLRVPGLTDKGVVSNALVEFIDLFPTLVEASGLPSVSRCPKASRNITLCHEGLSFVPLLTDPNRQWKTAAFSQYPRMSLQTEIIMGYSVKTDRFRYTEWVKINGGFAPPEIQRGRLKATELYDHFLDPDENVNRKSFKEYKDIVKDLHKILDQGWVAAYPQGADVKVTP